MANLAKIAKAITAFILTAAGVIGATPITGGQVSTTTLVTALVLAVITAVGTWAVPNGGTVSSSRPSV